MAIRHRHTLWFDELESAEPEPEVFVVSPDKNRSKEFCFNRIHWLRFNKTFKYEILHK